MILFRSFHFATKLILAKPNISLLADSGFLQLEWSKHVLGFQLFTFVLLWTVIPCSFSPFLSLLS